MRTRRYFLTGAGVLFAGCIHGGREDGSQDSEETDGPDDGSGENSGQEGSEEDDGETGETRGDVEGGQEETGSEEEGDEENDGELDLREANVMEVSVEGSNGRYTFDVTLYHDDEGEEGYANWWQVERLDGERLGRRELLHAHGTQRFTRSATVDSGDETCVVVRGHDQTHGYGGRAVVVNLETGETKAFSQGGEPSSFSEEDCP